MSHHFRFLLLGHMSLIDILPRALMPLIAQARTIKALVTSEAIFSAAGNAAKAEALAKPVGSPAHPPWVSAPRC